MKRYTGQEEKKSRSIRKNSHRGPHTSRGLYDGNMPILKLVMQPLITTVKIKGSPDPNTPLHPHVSLGEWTSGKKTKKQRQTMRALLLNHQAFWTRSKWGVGGLNLWRKSLFLSFDRERPARCSVCPHLLHLRGMNQGGGEAGSQGSIRKREWSTWGTGHYGDGGRDRETERGQSDWKTTRIQTKIIQQSYASRCLNSRPTDPQVFTPDARPDTTPPQR